MFVYRRSPFPFPLLAIFSPLPQTESLGQGKVHNLVFIIHSLVIGINCVANESKLERKLHFFKMKNTLFCVQFSTQNSGIAFQGFEISKYSGEEHPSDTVFLLQKNGTTGPLLIQSNTLFKPLTTSILLKPLLVSSTRTQNRGIQNMLRSS